MKAGRESVYQVARVGSATEMAAIRQQWSELHQQVGAPIFLTWDWVNTWWQNREPGWELWVLTACDEHGRMAGILPLMLSQHRYGPLRLRRLAFAGSILVYRNHLDVLARPEEKVSVFGSMVDYLKGSRGTWDVLDLESLVQGSPLVPYLSGAGGLFWELEPIVCPYTVLPESWETFEQEHLTSSHRWEIRNRRRRLERDYPGQVSYERVREADELPPALDAFAALHQKRWHGRGQGSSFDYASYAGFQRDFAPLALERGWLRLYMIKAGEHLIAAEYAFQFGGVLFGFATAFDPDWGQYSPGQLIMAYAVQGAIAEGVRELDLGRGTFDYKSRWTDRARVDAHVALSTRLPGHIWIYGGALYRGAKEMAREKLPDSWRQRINHLVAMRRAT